MSCHYKIILKYQINIYRTEQCNISKNKFLPLPLSVHVKGFQLPGELSAAMAVEGNWKLSGVCNNAYGDQTKSPDG